MFKGFAPHAAAAGAGLWEHGRHNAAMPTDHAMNSFAHALAPVLMLCASQALAQTGCASGGARAPLALFERFTSADCEACWRDAATPAPGAGALVLDWIVPGRQEDEAPLSAAATRDALARLQALGRAAPAATDVHTAPVEHARGLRLRVGQGPAVNDYLGTTATFTAARGGTDWSFHLLLVEHIPAGTEGTPVARNVVRNMLQGIWDKRQALLLKEHMRWTELRPMRIPEGAQPERLHTVGWVQDPQGRVVAAAQSLCR